MGVRHIYKLVDISEDVAEAGRQPIGFVEVAPAQRLPAPSPLFLLGAVNGQILEMLFGQLQLGRVGCYSLAGGEVSPEGLATWQELAFYSQTIGQPRYQAGEQVGRLNEYFMPVRKVHGPLVVLCRPDRADVVHWLSEVMPRLWVLAACGHDLAKLRYLVPHELPRAAGEMLALAGIGVEQLEMYGRDRVMLSADLVLIPTGLRRKNRISPLLAASMEPWTKSVRVRPASPVTAGRIFIDAPDDTNLANVDDIRDIAKQRGYVPVRLQGMNLAEQFAALDGAGRIVGCHAVTLCAAMLARPGTLICDLRPPLWSSSFLQSGIAQALGQHIGYVFGGMSDAQAPVFQIEPAMFESALDVMDLHRLQAGPTAS